MVAGRARAVVVGVGANTAMGSIRDSMLQTEDVSIIYLQFWTVICIWRDVHCQHLLFPHLPIILFSLYVEKCQLPIIIYLPFMYFHFTIEAQSCFLIGKLVAYKLVAITQNFLKIY